MLDEQTRGRIRDAVRDLGGRLDHDRRLEPYAERRWIESALSHPVLYLEDVSGIPFVSIIAGVEEYQHRARVRAGDGDLFAAVTRVQDGYEAYCREVPRWRPRLRPRKGRP